MRVFALRRQSRNSTLTTMNPKKAPRENVSTSATTTIPIEASNANLKPAFFDPAQVNSSSA